MAIHIFWDASRISKYRAKYIEEFNQNNIFAWGIYKPNKITLTNLSYKWKYYISLQIFHIPAIKHTAGFRHMAYQDISR